MGIISIGVPNGRHASLSLYLFQIWKEDTREESFRFFEIVEDTYCVDILSHGVRKRHASRFARKGENMEGKRKGGKFSRTHGF